jgi:hypothetical protein
MVSQCVLTGIFIGNRAGFSIHSASDSGHLLGFCGPTEGLMQNSDLHLYFMTVRWINP